jgi:predicted  nucleic acid-binding Zn-ribbon protein
MEYLTMFESFESQEGNFFVDDEEIELDDSIVRAKLDLCLVYTEMQNCRKDMSDVFERAEKVKTLYREIADLKENIFEMEAELARIKEDRKTDRRIKKF